jgi:cbb3-type cytochrome oxidase subunit 3
MGDNEAIGIVFAIVLVAFILFAFRQSTKSRPDDRGTS